MQRPTWKSEEESEKKLCIQKKIPHKKTTTKKRETKKNKTHAVHAPHPGVHIVPGEAARVDEGFLGATK
jgi:hypothetical protein